METLSTPLPDKNLQPLEANSTAYDGNVDENEKIAFKNNLPVSNRLSFGNISPINNSRNINSETTNNAISKDQSDESNTIVNGPLQVEELSSEPSCSVSSKTFDNGSIADSYDCVDSLSKEVDIEDVKEAILEMSQTVHKYIDKIKHLGISVEWELPKTLTGDKGLRKSLNGSKGPLDPEEVSFFKKRLKQFCKEYNINSAEIRACLSDKVSKFQFPNELRIKFLQYLCKDYINDRNPNTLLRAVTKLGIRKGKFSAEEENFLIDMYHNYNGSYFHSVCALMLNRHRAHIFKKIERLKRKNCLGSRPLNKINTKSLKLRRLILNNVLNRRNCALEGFKNRNVNTRSWKSIGREYNISPALAKAIFICELYPQLSAVHPVKFNRFFVKMIHGIKRSNWCTWEEVKWKKLSTMLFDVGPAFVYIMLRKIIKECVPPEKWGSFIECADYLHQNVVPYFENSLKKITLNRIIIEQVEQDS